jgi:hypothetical protein
MPANKGRMPRLALCDIKLRCGVIVRDTEPRLWRWREWPDGESGGDITEYQPAGALKEWKNQQNAK